jgi:hypothetical protein
MLTAVTIGCAPSPAGAAANWFRTHGLCGFFGCGAAALPVAWMGADAEAAGSTGAAWFAEDVTEELAI